MLQLMKLVFSCGNNIIITEQKGWGGNAVASYPGGKHLFLIILSTLSWKRLQIQYYAWEKIVLYRKMQQDSRLVLKILEF